MFLCPFSAKILICVHTLASSLLSLSTPWTHAAVEGACVCVAHPICRWEFTSFWEALLIRGLHVLPPASRPHHHTRDKQHRRGAMASGFGRGKVGRCYNIFSTFETCMVRFACALCGRDTIDAKHATFCCFSTPPSDILVLVVTRSRLGL